MGREHNYRLSIRWTGNNGSGTSDYRAYERSHSILIDGKPEIHASSDAAFRGDTTKHNPEDLFLASLSTCHMLWYLHLCADAGVIVTDYIDNAFGTMVESPDGGHFTGVMLNPVVTVTESSMIDTANELHDKAHAMCFIANSVNFTVGHRPLARVAEVSA